MKKFYSALTALLLAFGVAGNSFAVEPGDLGILGVPSSHTIGNSTDAFDAQTNVWETYFFEVDALASFGGDAISNIQLTGLGEWSSFNVGLYYESAPTVWTALASNVGTLSAPLDRWTSTVTFSPLTEVTEYAFIVSGSKVALTHASYGGTVSLIPVAAIPEPEVYAMLAAGLGIMGWVARRRKQQVA